MFRTGKKALIVTTLLAFALMLVLSACSGSGVKNSEISKPEDLKGKKVGVQVSTTADDSCKELQKTVEFELKKYDQIIQTFSELKTGRIDAIVVDEVVARDYVAKHPADYKVTGARLTNEPIGICFKKENAGFRNKVNAIIDDMAKDGALKEISVKWFGEDLTSNIKNVGAADAQGTSDPSFQLPADKKELVIGIDNTYPPMEYSDDSGNLVGFDIDLAKEIGKRLNLEVKFISNAWDGIFTALNTDKFDCILSSVSINEDRLQNFALTKPYIANAQVIVVKP